MVERFCEVTAAIWAGGRETEAGEMRGAILGVALRAACCIFLFSLPWTLLPTSLYVSSPCVEPTVPTPPTRTVPCSAVYR